MRRIEPTDPASYDDKMVKSCVIFPVSAYDDDVDDAKLYHLRTRTKHMELEKPVLSTTSSSLICVRWCHTAKTTSSNAFLNLLHVSIHTLPTNHPFPLSCDNYLSSILLLQSFTATHFHVVYGKETRRTAARLGVFKTLFLTILIHDKLLRWWVSEISSNWIDLSFAMHIVFILFLSFSHSHPQSS